MALEFMGPDRYRSTEFRRHLRALPRPQARALVEAEREFLRRRDDGSRDAAEQGFDESLRGYEARPAGPRRRPVDAWSDRW